MTQVNVVIIDGNNLSLEQINAVANEKAKVSLSKDALKKIKSSRKYIEKIIKSGDVVYGVNTGFGILSDVTIDSSEIEELQQNLIRSHSIGVGEHLSIEAVRAAMLLRANTLAKGVSGVRPVIVETLIQMLNSFVHPIIPEKGSVGASGDLAPLAHMALCMIGRGQAEYKGKIYKGKTALKKAGIPSVQLQAKEGLALINGTQIMTAIAAIALIRADNLSKIADIAGAMTIEAILASSKPFNPRIHKVRAHVGQKICAGNMRKLLKGSKIVASHKGCGKVQDAYSLRCIPQVHGASRDAIEYLRKTILVEANSATDNPLVFEDDDMVLSGGNFHGQPVALACDFAGIAVSELANISERRVEQLVNPNLSSGLPAFLVTNKGLNSGYMIAQVTSASLVSENKILSHPSSVDSIPSSAGREDHVSMGTIGARKLLTIIANAEEALAVELLCAAQAIDFRYPLTPSDGTRAAHDLIREQVPFLDEDRTLYLDQKKVLELLRSGKIVSIVEKTIGGLK